MATINPRLGSRPPALTCAATPNMEATLAVIPVHSHRVASPARTLHTVISVAHQQFARADASETGVGSVLRLPAS